MQDPITMVAVGAAFSDMPPFVFEKIGKLVAHISNTVALSRIPPLDPYLGFSKEAMSVMEFLASPEVLAGAGGAGLGALGAHLVVDKADPQRGTKILLSGLGGGALGSGVAHAFSRGSSSSKSRAGAEKKESPSPAKEPEARLEGIPAEVRTPESQSTRAAIPAAEVEPRLRSSEQRVRQQATQQQQQQAVQMASQREQANLLKDQGRVQARIRHILSPQTTAQPSSGPRNLVVGPGGRTLFQRGQQPPQGVLQASGGRGQSKMAQDLQDIYRWVANNPEAIGALGGGAIGGMTGWSTPGVSDKIRRRRMLTNAVLGAGIGAGGGHLVRKLQGISAASKAVKRSADAVRDAAESAGRELVGSGGSPGVMGEAEGLLGALRGEIPGAAAALRGEILGTGEALRGALPGQ